MPKGKGKGGRRGGETKAERAYRRAIARELPTIKAVLASSASTRRDSESVVDAASLNIVTSNVSGRTGRITELVLDTDVDTVMSAIAPRRRPNPVSTPAIAVNDATVARNAKRKTGPRATRENANRATSTWTGPKLVSKSTQVVLQPEPPRRPRVLLII